MSFVFFVNGLTLVFAALLMAVDAALFPETEGDFAIASLTTGTLGLLIAIAASSSLTAMRRSHTFLLTTSVWVTAALAGAVPLHMWGLTEVDAVFEAMSGITTTGSSVMTGLDNTPRGILMWRAMLQGMGGVGFVVTAIALLPMLKVGGMQLFRTESSDKGDKELASAARFAGATMIVYVLLIVICIVFFLAGGMTTFDAVAHALATISTGGFSTHDASFGFFGSPFLQWSATLFMLLGALPMAWYIRAFQRGILASEQVRAMLISLSVSIAVISVWLVHTSHMAPLDALRLVAFNVVSVVTTTGFATADYTTWGPFAVAAFFFLTAAGGCTGSTAGGAKAMRWIIVVRRVRIQIRRIGFSHSVTALKYEGRTVGNDVLSGVVAFFSFYVATILVLAAALSLTGLDVSTSLSGALTAVANVGPGVGPVIGPAGNFAGLGDTAKLLLVFGMFAGRLEMLTVYVLFTATFWREL